MAVTPIRYRPSALTPPPSTSSITLLERSLKERVGSLVSKLFRFDVTMNVHDFLFLEREVSSLRREVEEPHNSSIPGLELMQRALEKADGILSTHKTSILSPEGPGILRLVKHDDWWNQKRQSQIGSSYFAINLANPGAPIFEGVDGLYLDRAVHVGCYNRGREYLFGKVCGEFRLPGHKASLPASLRRSLSHFKGKIERIQTIINCKDIISAKTGVPHFNLVTHPWIFPDTKPGINIKKNVLMGLFETVGITPVKSSEGLSIDGLKPMEVHVHPKGGAMACSPDNARFQISPDAPFSAFISVVIDEKRAIITQYILLNAPEDPACSLILDALTIAGTLAEYVDHLKNPPIEGSSDLARPRFNSRQEELVERQRVFLMPLTPSCPPPPLPSQSKDFSEK